MKSKNWVIHVNDLVSSFLSCPQLAHPKINVLSPTSGMGRQLERPVIGTVRVSQFRTEEIVAAGSMLAFGRLEA